MTEDEARNLLLVRAVEVEDRAEALLTREDRQSANAAALSSNTPSHSGRGSEQRFLAERANFAATRLTTRQPLVARAIKYSRWPRWISWTAPLASLFLGFVTNELGLGKRLNIIAFPLVGLFAWNFAIYVWTLWHTLLRLPAGRRKKALSAPKWTMRLATIGQTKFAGQDAVSRALIRFLKDWAQASGRITGLRTARTLHLGAALFATGVIGGMYLRALGVEYRAGWESTFLGPGAVHSLVTTLLGPASLVTGVPLPGVPRIMAMRWTGPIGGGENAGPWIHLYAATAVGFVIVPRLLLAGWNSLGALRLQNAFPVPGREDFYIRRLLRGAQGGTSQVRVTPYAYTPSGEAKRNLSSMLEAALGEGVQVRIDAPVEYGSEEQWLADASLSPSTDHHLILYNLSSTPETENHGVFARGLARKLAEERSGTTLAMLLDEASFRHRIAGTENRIEARRAAWQQALFPMHPVTIDLSVPLSADAASAPRLEAALLNDAGLAETRR